jgi:hypothetical protein
VIDKPRRTVNGGSTRHSRSVKYSALKLAGESREFFLAAYSSDLAPDEEL